MVQDCFFVRSSSNPLLHGHFFKMLHDNGIIFSVIYKLDELEVKLELIE